MAKAVMEMTSIVWKCWWKLLILFRYLGWLKISLLFYYVSRLSVWLLLSILHRDLETFPPACLPTEEFNLEGSVGHVYGEEKTLLSMARRQFCFLWQGENSIWVTKACVLTKLIALYWKVSNGKWAVCQKQDGALQETTVQSNFETLRSALKRCMRSYESQT